MKNALLTALLFLLPARAMAIMTATGVQTLSSAGVPSTNFGSNDTITLVQRINNSAAVTGQRIVFQFQIVSPTGGQGFLQQGNAVPATAGNSQSSLSGLPVSAFFNIPGNYTLNAIANLNGQKVTQTAVFTVSSPNIVLTYPPNGAQNLTDSPLTFRWVANGGQTYRVTVGDNPSFYNSLFTQNTPAGQSFLGYPTNPTDSRERLTTGQVYYWKVDALDTNGNVVATSQPPFTFTVANAALTRDLSVTSLTIMGSPDPQGNVPFQVVVKNQGNTTETNVPLAFSLGGITAVGSPATISSIGPGASLTFNFSAMPLPGQAQSLAVACLQFFDDVMNNNCQSLNVTPSAVAAAGGPTGGPTCTVNESATQIWAQIDSLLQTQGYNLGQYNLTGMEGSMNACELMTLLNDLKQGSVQITDSGGAGSPTFVQASTGSAIALVEEGQQWSGMTQALSRNLRTFTIVEDDVWQKLWPHLDAADPAPAVDFTRYSVVGLIGGRYDDISDIRIEDVAMGRKGLHVRYAVTGEASLASSGSDGHGAVPYILRVAPRAGGEARFEELKDKERNR